MAESNQQTTSDNRIRVLVADDHDRVRGGLATVMLAFDDMLLVGEAEDGGQALDMCEQLKPDVVLMDLKMPKMDGVAATHMIRQRWPHIRVIALTTLGETELIQAALQAGAVTYLLKNISADELARAIREAYIAPRPAEAS